MSSSSSTLIATTCAASSSRLRRDELRLLGRRQRRRSTDGGVELPHLVGQRRRAGLRRPAVDVVAEHLVEDRLQLGGDLVEPGAHGLRGVGMRRKGLAHLGELAFELTRGGNHGVRNADQVVQ